MKRMMSGLAVLTAAAVTVLILHAQTAPSTAPATGAADNLKLPPNETGNQGNGPVSKARIDKSQRHGEWQDLTVPGAEKKLHTWVVYPERPDKAPVVLVIMEIYGMTDWVRATTDQLAADGFIAIAPDFMSKTTATSVNGLQTDEVNADLNAARDYGLSLPSANGKVGCVGFCWGGTHSFAYAIAQPKLNAAVVFYGTPPMVTVNGAQVPDEAQLTKITCPIAGFFGGSDQRVTAAVAPTVTAMKKLNKSYDPHIYDNTGHGFMRQQFGSNFPAGNQKAATEAWPLVLKFLNENLKAQ